MTAALLPCPFCGGSATCEGPSPECAAEIFYVGCAEGCTGQIGIRGPKDWATNKWNMRPTPARGLPMTDRSKTIEVMAREAFLASSGNDAIDEDGVDAWAALGDKQEYWIDVQSAALTAYESHLQASGMAVVPVDALRDEARACWELINSMIEPGPLPGNGTDKSAQRNGLVLAANAIFDRAYWDRSASPSGKALDKENGDG